MKQEIISTFEATTAKLTDVLSSFGNDTVNTVPFEGSWTAAMTADHILKSQSVFPELLKGRTIDTEREPEEKTESIKKLFLDFSNKMKSPDFIEPSAEPLDKKELLQRISKKKEEIVSAMKDQDLTKTVLQFELPGFGAFTGAEWSRFIIYHTQRHIHQLENIRKKITEG